MWKGPSIENGHYGIVIGSIKWNYIFSKHSVRAISFSFHRLNFIKQLVNSIDLNKHISL